MTKADAARLVAIVVTAYPNFDKFKDAKAIEATVNLWAMMFEQDESGIVALAVKKHIATNKWPPSVAEIREIMLEIQHPELIEPDNSTTEISPASFHLWWRVPLSQSAGLPSGKCTAAHT